ncbi:hypothetical protein L873DRAFT_1809085 [Choiromyces venosus 120613-1]|uniref:Uncharacterized protein n=1 Tax=Choiromyces venosus 120613-1 TaxID=1336337 RepID=A0A3N4JW86_9PEZI|nr:hypothetical protein L873DRAFT_1809085 [Choiromyces venosus 120613-1]
MHAVQPNSNDPSFGPEGEPFLNADRNHGDRPAYRKPSREPIPQGFAEKASGPIVEYTWPQPGRPSAVPPREKATSHLPPAAPPPRKVAKHQPPAQKTAVTAQTVATTPPKNVTKGEPAEQKRAVGTLTLDTMVMVTPTEYTTNQPTQGTLNVSLKRPATTITETIIPNELSVKLKELDGKLKGLGKGLRRLKPKIRSIVNHKKKKFQ